MRHTAEEQLRSYQSHLETLVAERTQALAAANRSLEDEHGELVQLLSKVEEAQAQLLQSEKMAAIGQLAAGVAHEINNPIGFINSNFGTLEEYIGDIFTILSAYERVEAQADDDRLFNEVREARKRVDYDFLKQDITDLMAESIEGINRVRQIVKDLKDFSRVDARQEWEWTDLRRGLDSTLNIVNNEVKYKADVVRDYGPMPDVQCLASEINQVFMNLLVNAAHAIDKPRGTITLRCGHDDGPDGGTVWVQIEDDGCGIPAENLQRIFDPFFTTKPVGHGTGLGLSLSYGIVQKHGGRLTVDSQVGRGTRFHLVLPVRRAGGASA